MIRSRTSRLAAAALSRRQWTCPACLSKRQYSKQPEKREPPDHRKLGNQQELFMTSVYSPGSPIFLPNGARIFNRLVDFLRKQYVRYGFQEVITPTIYKKSLWAKSGHLENYAEDMYSVTGNKRALDLERTTGCCGTDHAKNEAAVEEDDDYGLKPMNCPGHCLIFASKLHSYRDLPVRYADFSPLHRNEISGALSGLTRVRRFHQDDGHIFCRPSQVEGEIKKTLDFVKTVYSVLRLGVSYRLALSTRPKDHYIGTEEEWARAEDSLKRALDASGMEWTINEGDGAFYGPKIDIVLKDSEGKEHQTATIQLDFQLPKRFELEYQAPAPEYEARGETTDDPELLANYGPVRPVMIHRAVLGSVERLLALLIENYDGKWPFWLNPRQAIILTVNTSDPVVEWADEVRNILLGNKKLQADGLPSLESLSGQTGLAVDMDTTARPLGTKIREAHASGYGLVLVVGEQDAKNQQVSLGKERLSPLETRDRMLRMVDTFE
ncbi:tRNA synthetase class II core domain (G, h, p, S and t) domain-containing protein [Trichoderma breve]|uniref:threonine--tRNA ligase n=1 Tax=Trichoderma breve TaxID=2034170 RepID=A0A9W9BG37_9HYPO|nr:tRNA synthetase class II core domain (G, h, p, S and t) domain-containing protein [Trichoderma breve]KAJ4862718.1 tRNA synthetase class II core domain (G, h, p, S and t) domain-containing protein [Trichoderma breve]